MRYLPSAAIIAVAVATLRATALVAGQLPVAAVDFTPVVQEKLRLYGTQESATLQAAILESVSREAARTTLPEGLTVTVTVRDIAPTHPTSQQATEDPTLDVVHTRYAGGAELVGEVRDANQHVLTTVRYRNFTPTLRLGAKSFDPWADARLAIDGFAVKLAKACGKLAAH